MLFRPSLFQQSQVKRQEQASASMSEHEANIPFQNAQNIVSYIIPAQEVEEQQPLYRVIKPLMAFPTLNQPPSQVHMSPIDHDNYNIPSQTNTDPNFYNSQEILDDDQDAVTIVSTLSANVNSSQLGRMNRRRKKRRKRALNPLEIDSKQQSVQQIRQQPPKPVIQLEPQSAVEGIENLYQMMEEQHQSNAQINTILNIGQNLTQQELTNLFAKVIIDANANEISNLNEVSTNSGNPKQAHFQQLFEKQMQILNKQADPALLSLVYANSLNQIEAADGEVVHIPKVIAEIPKKIIPLISQKLPQICQQLVLMSFYDLVTGEQDRQILRNFVKSNYKSQICDYILTRNQRIDPEYNYSNVQILKLISSGYVWDNVIPFMAESLYKDCGQVKVRMLPERSNSDSITILKYQAFLILCQMFFAILPRQIATYDLPISFGEIMTLGQNDPPITTQIKLAKVKCLLHYFSSILRQKEGTIRSSVQFIAFQRFRVSLRARAIYPQTDDDRVRYRGLKLTDHLSVTRVKPGNEYSRETAVYLTHENPCRQSGEESPETSFLMQETYRLVYAKPQIFILRALTPKLDLGEAIIVHGLQEFSKCKWEVQNQSGQAGDDELGPHKFVCQGLLNQDPQFDAFGKRKGTVILILSKLLFSQSYVRNEKDKPRRITDNYSFADLKIEVETLYSAFQGRKQYCGEDQRVLISQRYIKFIEDDIRWLYFMIVWIAASIAKVKCIFQFKRSEDENQAVFLMQRLDGWSIENVFDSLSHYRETIIEAQENWNQFLEKLNDNIVITDNVTEGLNFFSQQEVNKATSNYKRVSSMTFLDFLKYEYL